MNAPFPLQTQLAVNQAPPPNSDDEINLLEYWDIIVDNRWLVAAITALAFVVGLAYALVANPIYESNLLIQVEDSQNSAKSLLGDAANLFDVKTAATAEIEIIRSRMVIGQAVDNTRLFLDASPKYLPVLGRWLSRHADGISDPILFGWVTGKEQIKLSSFEVPADLEDTQFRVTALGNGEYSLSHPELPTVKGRVGSPLFEQTPSGPLSLTIETLQGKPGAQFNAVRHSRLAVIESLQRQLQLAEKGRQSGVIDVRLQSADREKLTLILNEIGRQYVKQNVERKSAEAQKTLAFLDVQLPQFKSQLERSEEAYSRYRNKNGTVALDDEAKLILQSTVDLHGKLIEAQQKRRELVARFTSEHPAVKTLDQQIAAWNREIDVLNQRVKALPTVQQGALRLERDFKLNDELYQQLRNSAIQLQLVREGKIGNARLIDPAFLPKAPIKPNRLLVLVGAIFAGLVCGFAAAIARNKFFRGILNAQEIEAHTGLNVYSTIPLSDSQSALARDVKEKKPGQHILADLSPQDVAIESLRSLRTALQFALLEAGNNRVLITGATPGVGKSFVSANFSAVLASAGKRVLLIDADLRRGHLNQYFGVPRPNGLSELIAGTATPAEAIRRGVLPGLDLITTGTLPPNPAELLTRNSLSKLLEELSGRYDTVILDTAPVLAAADTLSVATYAGAILLVARARETQLGELHESARRLALAGRQPSGAILNAIDLARRHYGAYGYEYGGYKYRYYGYGHTS